MAAANQDSLTMRLTLFAIRNAFPKVKQLETEVLESWMNGDEIEDLVLLDVREMDEYKVSHLSGALAIKPDEPVDQVVTKINDKLWGKLDAEMRRNGCVKIVAYCSIGYRSSNMAQKIYHELKRLKETEGFENMSMEVYNLEGSIFKWANEGRRMVDCENHETQYCHPYSLLWGQLLDGNLRKYEPALNVPSDTNTDIPTAGDEN